ncbi:MAG TPA: aldehyde dehydrogenase family protein [Acidimicrobiales bacterium]|nr:aldehyde dehydrogenase family protein [Acidimicrobiales bacterium]
MDVRDKIYIDGAWVPSSGSGTLDVIDSTTEEVIGTIPDGTAEDVDRAAEAAARAFKEWSATSVEERAKLLSRVSESLAARMDEIGELISHEVGMPLSLSKLVQAGLPIGTFADVAQRIAEYPFEEKLGTSLIVREPVGVVGAITPWNYPLHQIANKVAPAIGVGCTVVLKPSEVAPLNAFLLAEVLDEVGLPPGVFNLVSGTGPVVGEAIASHPKVDMVSFTGSTRAGKRVMQLAAESVKRVALELGGKSANIILDDADLATAVTGGVFACYINSGQTCSALTRMLVPRSKLQEAEELAVSAAETYTPGDPFDSNSRLGPLVSAVQRDRVRGYIQKGLDQGAKLLTGGAEPPEGLDKGFFVRPTVFSEVTPDMTIAQEEIFGPVLSIMPYDTEEEAIEIANDTIYGLAGGVWAGDNEHAERVARQLRTGQVDVNGGGFNSVAPFGGYKQSGIGRELGPFGIEEFLEVKSLQVPAG